MRIITVLTIAISLSFTVEPVKASSENAWKEFRQAVEAKCRAGVPERFKIERLRIDPFGSESYGIAVVDGTDTTGNEKQTLVCIYDKRRQTIEMSGPLDQPPAKDGGGGAP